MEQKNNTTKKIFNTIGNILITLYVILALVISLMVFSSMETGQPSLFGYTFMFVKTDSMEGDAPDAIFKGDLVLCEQRDDYFSLETGEVIAYSVTVYDESDQPVEIVKIHRIIGMADDGVSFITMGDNAPGADDVSVFPNCVLGVYTGIRVPAIGSIFEFIQSQNGILFCLVIPMAAFFIYALFKFVKAMIDYKLEKATSGAPAADGELTEEQKQKAIEEYLAKQAAEANKDENNTDDRSE